MNSIDSQKYTYIDNLHAPKEEVEFSGPLSTPDKNDQFWKDVENELFDYSFQLRYSENSPNLDLRFKEKPANIVRGVINLINMIIEKNNTDPIDYVFFLDKSARLAAHVFRVMWSILEKQHKIPEGVISPKIKFINIGQGEDKKHDSVKANQMATESFDDIPENSNILMVDEVVSSGKSLIKSIQFARKNLRSKAVGVANFLTIPIWYKKDQVKGVQDVELGKKVFDLMDQMETEVFSLLEKICKSNLPIYDILEFIEDALYLKKQEFINKYIERPELALDINPNLLSRIHDELYQLPLDEIVVFKYFKTSGGFFAMRSPRSEYRQSLMYRKMLTKMVELSSDLVQLNY